MKSERLKYLLLVSQKHGWTVIDRNHRAMTTLTENEEDIRCLFSNKSSAEKSTKAIYSPSPYVLWYFINREELCGSWDYDHQILINIDDIENILIMERK